MADPVEIMTTVISLAKKAYTTYQSIQDAPKQVKEVETNVLRLEGLLQGHLDTLSRGGHADRHDRQLNTLVTEARDLLESSMKFLDKATTVGDRGVRTVSKVKWPLRSAECVRLGERFAKFFRVHSAVHGSLIMCVFWFMPSI